MAILEEKNPDDPDLSGTASRLSWGNKCRDDPA